MEQYENVKFKQVDLIDPIQGENVNTKEVSTFSPGITLLVVNYDTEKNLIIGVTAMFSIWAFDAEEFFRKTMLVNNHN